uniref:Uncharacterized protein n=1 Tax=Acrobeloides nanus TaxID=290746 RepID=A0A914E297_9BILA
MLLCYVCIMGYTKDNLLDSIRSRSVEIYEQYKKFPLFSNYWKSALIPGDPLLTDKRFIDWFSKKTGIPRPFLSSKSFRKGFATAIANETLLNDSNATDNEVLSRVRSTANWLGKVAKRYYPQDQQVQLGSHRVYGKSVDIPLMESITQKSAVSVFLSKKFLAIKMTRAEENEIKKIYNMERTRKAEQARNNSVDKKRMEELLGATAKKLIKELSEDDQKEYYKCQTSVNRIEVKVHNQVLTKYEDIRDKITRKRWLRTVDKITIEERFIPLKERFSSNLDFEQLQAKFSSIVIPPPTRDLSFIG